MGAQGVMARGAVVPSGPGIEFAPFELGGGCLVLRGAERGCCLPWVPDVLQRGGRGDEPKCVCESNGVREGGLCWLARRDFQSTGLRSASPEKQAG